MGNMLCDETNVAMLPYVISSCNSKTSTKAKKRRFGRSRNRRRPRGFALEEVNNLSDANFTSMFRISRDGFEQLFTLISPFLPETDAYMAHVSSGSL